MQKNQNNMNYIDYLKEGSGIHIKKKNRGKFTDYCGGKVTEECIARGKNSPSATIRKRATFAANARKWKHKDGGIIKAAKGTYIDTGRTVDKIREQDKKNQKEYKNDLNKFNSNLQIQDLPEQEEQETIQSSNTSTSSNDGSWINQFLIKTVNPVIDHVHSGVRSDRNNNPLNIRFTNINWEGKKTQNKSDADFEEFESRDYGWRAAYRNIQTKIDRGLNTISKLIKEWAPPSENNTSNYIQVLSSKTGIDPDAVISEQDLPKIGAVMAAIEAGKDDIDWDDALKGYNFYKNKT